MVNLGWVPLEERKSIARGNTEPLPALTWENEENSKEFFRDHYTNFVHKPDDPDNSNTLTEVTGIVRKGETENWLLGRRNWAAEGNFGYIELKHMIPQFKLLNYEQATEAYIERLVATDEEADPTSYPVPATKNTIMKDYLTPERHKQYSKWFGLCSVAGVLGGFILG